MSPEDVRLTVREVLREHFAIEPGSRLGDEDSFLGTGAIDSAGMIRLIGHLEQRFNISVLDNEILAENFDSVRQATEFVYRKLA